MVAHTRLLAMTGWVTLTLPCRQAIVCVLVHVHVLADLNMPVSVCIMCVKQGSFLRWQQLGGMPAINIQLGTMSTKSWLAPLMRERAPVRLLGGGNSVECPNWVSIISPGLTKNRRTCGLLSTFTSSWCSLGPDRIIDSGAKESAQNFSRASCYASVQDEIVQTV